MAPSDPRFSVVFNILLFGGIILFFIGVALIPSARKEINKERSILEIVSVRLEVTISDISYETGLESEYIREVLTKYLMNGLLFGYIDGNLFVRDTAARPRYPGRTRGLFEASD